jgi:hypothetical protein
MKQIYYWLAGLIILVSWIGNGLYYHSMQLPEPLFLKHYIEVSDAPGDRFELRFLENLNETRQINQITIEKLPHVKVYSPISYDNYTHQRLGRVIFEIRQSKSLSEPLIINSIQAHYNDGTEQTMDIGEIRVYPKNTVPNDNPENLPIHHSSGGSSNNNSGYSSLYTLEPLQLTNITSTYLSRYAPWLEIYVASQNSLGFSMLGVKQNNPNEIHSSPFTMDGIRLEEMKFPFKLDTKQSLKVSHQFVFPENNSVQESFSITQMYLWLTYMDNNNKEWTSRTFISYTPNLSNSDVRSIVKMRRDMP